jgi:hypothetical protein
MTTKLYDYLRIESLYKVTVMPYNSLLHRCLLPCDAFPANSPAPKENVSCTSSLNHARMRLGSPF